MVIKRIIDLLLSTLGLLLFVPFMLIIALLIFISSGSPVFFRQSRVGKNGRIFKIVKFRTMLKNADKLPGGSYTTSIDSRITRIGKILRRWKLDELLTLWNVLKGDLSLVGPRPEVPGYADKLQGEEKRILKIRPGVTGPATLKYAKEEQILAKVDDPKKYNDEVLYPDKIKINLEYLDNWSIWQDIKIIFKTIFRKNY